MVSRHGFHAPSGHQPTHHPRPRRRGCGAGFKIAGNLVRRRQRGAEDRNPRSQRNMDLQRWSMGRQRHSHRPQRSHSDHRGGRQCLHGTRCQHRSDGYRPIGGPGHGGQPHPLLVGSRSHRPMGWHRLPQCHPRKPHHLCGHRKCGGHCPERHHGEVPRPQRQCHSRQHRMGQLTCGDLPPHGQ